MACLSSWQLQHTHGMLPRNLHAVGTGLWLYNGKLQAHHNHLTASLSDSIHNLKSELHSGLKQHIGNTFDMQSM